MTARDLLLIEQAPARRGFLRSLVMAPVAALATHRLILPGEVSQEDRARRAWAEFSAAMTAITANESGWMVIGGERRPFQDLRNQGPFLNLRAIFYETDGDPRARSSLVERHRELLL